MRRLGRRLKGLPPAEVVGFGEHWLAAHARAYRWPVWNSAELLLGWIGDDSFADFTNWLIAQGQTTYEQVVANPDTSPISRKAEPMP